MMEAIGDYEFSRADLLGCGAFAQVYKGRHKKEKDLRVAIKLLHKKALPRARTLLQKEIKILKSLSDLQHENLVALLDCKETSTDICLVMEFCNAGDLADYLNAKHRLSVDVVRFFFRQIARAMCSLQSKGVVHRDLKPQNILLCHGRRGKALTPYDYTLKIADFGFARVLQEGMMAATLCGSPLYMAPEVIMTQTYDGRADLWSIGTIMYQCLYGVPPFKASTPAELKHKYEVAKNLKPNLDSLVKGHLRDLILGLLKKDAKDRISFDNFFHHPFFSEESPKPPASSPVACSAVSRQDSLPQIDPASSSSHSASPSTAITPPKQRLQQPGRVAAGPSPRTAAVAPRTHTPSSSPAQPSLRQGAVRPGSREIPPGSKEIRPPSSSGVRPSEPMEHDTADYVIVDVSDASDMHAPATSSRPVPPRRQQQRFFVMNRPQSLPVTAKDARPIPVPCQSQAFAEIRQRISPATQGSRGEEPMERGTPQPSPRPSPHPSPAARRHGAVTPAASLESLSPPAGLDFSVGTPPSLGLRRRSGSASPGAVPLSPQRMRSQGSLLPRLPALLPTDGTSEPWPESRGRRLTSPDLDPSHCLERCVTVPARLDYRGLPEQLLPANGFSRGNSPPTAAVVPFVRRRSETESRLQPSAAQSPDQPPVWFHVPDLQEETLLDDEHNTTLHKLLFIQQLTSSIIEFADSRLQNLGKAVPAVPATDTEDQESMETLCLYSRAVDLARDALSLAVKQKQSGALQNTHKMRTVVSELNQFYKLYTSELRTRWNLPVIGGQLQEAQRMEMIGTADNLVYQHVVETCKQATVKELFERDLDECLSRYQTAKNLLHYLVWQARPHDKLRLKHYYQNVDSRLASLLCQGGEA